ncbi:MAG: class II fructose-bisphosphatase [Bdellovibrionales bacterium]
MIPNRYLAIELVRVTEAAALSAAQWVGRGDEKAADQAAVDAMRDALNLLDIDGTVVIGEGERDEAPMLYIGERVGALAGKGEKKYDIALDPLEGTTITAKGGSNALAVCALAETGGFLHAPDVYMEKIAIGPGYAPGLVSLTKSPEENIAALAKAKGVAVNELTVCILDRERHKDLIATVRKTGVRIAFIQDGDVSGVIATTSPDSGIDMYMGSGGSPEGVLAAAALRCTGGQFQGRLIFRNDDEKARAAKAGITDFNRIYQLEDLARGDVMFAATGVTDGAWLRGVRYSSAGATTQSIVMRSKSGTVRMIDARHSSRKAQSFK